MQPQRDSCSTTPHPTAKYFVMKCNSVGSLLQQQQYGGRRGLWAVPLRKHAPHPHELLNHAFIEQQCQVVLIFSVSGTKLWKGYATMASPIESSVCGLFDGLANDVHVSDRLSPPFEIEWKSRFPDWEHKGLHFTLTANISNSLENDQSVNLSRNCQELDAASGALLCKMIDEAVQIEEAKIQEAQRIKQEALANRPHFFVVTPQTENEKRWDGFVAEVSKVGNLLFASHIGSRGCNLHHEASDVDMLAIAAYPTEQILSFIPPKQTLKNREGFEPDFTVHEVKYFCELLLSGDSRMVETLFQCEQSVVLERPEFSWLRANHALFLTRKVIDKYVSEVEGNKGIPNLLKLNQKLQPGDEKGRLLLCKKWYIVHKLLIYAQQLAIGKPLKVWFDDDSEERHFLLSIRRGDLTHEQLLERAQHLLDEVHHALSAGACPLPCDAPQALPFIKKWVFKIRTNQMQTSEAVYFKSPADADEAWLAARGRDANEEVNDLDSEISSLADKGKVLFLIRRSDGSYCGVYAAPTRDILSDPFYQLPENLTSKDGAKTEYAIYELAKFAEMVFTGNPSCVEVLFAPDATHDGPPRFLYESSAWKGLKAVRDAFLTERALLRAIGYLEGYMRSLNKKKPKQWQKMKKADFGQGMVEEEHHRGLPAQFLRIFQFLKMCLRKLDTAQQQQQEEEAEAQLQEDQHSQQHVEVLEACRSVIQQLEARKPWNLGLGSDSRGLLEEWVVQIRKDVLCQKTTD